MNQIIEVKDMNLEEAVALCKSEYMEEKQKGKVLPDINQEMEEMFEQNVRRAKGAPYGKALLCEGRLAGFIAFFGPWNGFHGVEKGVFSPLGASAFGGDKREKTASLLLEAAAQEMVKDKIFSIAMSRYAGDKEVNQVLCLNSFGIRCSDAMLVLQEYVSVKKNDEIVIEELKTEKRWEIEGLYEKLRIHLSKSPCFFPTPAGQTQKWFENDSRKIIVAKENDKIIGYMAMDDDAETFVTERADMSNICGAYVLEEYRAKGVANRLLDAVVEICMREGKSYLGVDYETINPTALHFWTKKFEPYTYSFIRRIDERIYQYE